METVPTNPLPPIVRAAIAAIDAFGIDNRDDADRCLSLWARVDQLTDEQYAQVLAHYPDTAGGAR